MTALSMARPTKEKKAEDGIWRLSDGRWFVDMQPGGRHSDRIRSTHDTRADAKQKKNEIIKLSTEGKKLKQASDTRRLSDICESWYTYHGNTLSSGKKRLNISLVTCKALGNPRVDKIDPKDFVIYRTERLKSGTTANHINHELTYLKGAFNVLINLNDWQLDNPYGKLKKLPLAERAHRFLNNDEIVRLLHVANDDDSRNKDLAIVITICLSIGCRFGEANDLDAEQVHNAKIHLQNTKNKRKRSIPIPEALEKEILSGRPRSGRLFTST